MKDMSLDKPDRLPIYIRKEMLKLFDNMVDEGLISICEKEDVSYHDYIKRGNRYRSCTIEAELGYKKGKRDDHKIMNKLRLLVLEFVENLADEIQLNITSVVISREEHIKAYIKLERTIYGYDPNE